MTTIEHVELLNYKSIAQCDVELRPLTVVVGRNGSGKSNFVDSLHFIADALLNSLDFALRRRGGIKTVTRKRAGTHLRIAISLQLSEELDATFSLELDRGVVASEELTVKIAEANIPIAHYRRSDQTIRAEVAGETLRALPVVLSDRLALAVLSGLPAFRDSFDALSGMRFYRLDPDAMRQLQDADEGIVLREDGSNVSGVWGRLQKFDPAIPDRLTRYLEAMVPELKRIRRVTLESKETLRFYQSSTGGRETSFQATSMSDGTLRALGALVASRQNNGTRVATVVTIEEPETALHPGAVAALMDAFHEACSDTQIIITSHSPDVLDHVDLETDALLVTESRDGATIVAGVDAASREAIRRHLYTPGELLRMDQLQPASR